MVQVQFIKIQSIYDLRHLSTVLVYWSGIMHKTRSLFYGFCYSKNHFWAFEIIPFEIPVTLPSVERQVNKIISTAVVIGDTKSLKETLYEAE